MKIRPVIILVLAAAVSLASCGSPPSASLPAATATPLPHTPSAVPATSSPAPAPTAIPPEPSLSRAQYHLEAAYDPGRQEMVVSEKIIYPNLTGEDLDQLALVIESSRTRGVFKLYQFAWGDMDGEEIESYTLADGLLLLPLRETLHPGEAIELFLVYSLTLPKQPGPFGYTGRQTNLTDWYAFVPPYTAQRHWVYSPPGKVGEHLVYETADFFVDIMIDDEDYRLAGPTATEETQDGYRYYLREARAFSWSASKETLVFEYDQGGIPIS
ncbi:MAG: hypothetical protein OEY93_03645, partial [Anaerolineae bacterium]|nr:hypothetical protein [Anaerolineae bacterium]